MPVPFGVGVGDFIAVGKLIGSIITELQAVLAFIHLHMQLSGTNDQIEWTREPCPPVSPFGTRSTPTGVTTATES